MKEPLSKIIKDIFEIDTDCLHQDYGGETDHIFAELIGSKKR